MREDVLKELPSSLEAEQALISSVINIPSKIQEVEDILSVDDFYWDRHKQIYGRGFFGLLRLQDIR